MRKQKRFSGFFASAFLAFILIFGELGSAFVFAAPEEVSSEEVIVSEENTVIVPADSEETSEQAAGETIAPEAPESVSDNEAGNISDNEAESVSGNEEKSGSEEAESAAEEAESSAEKTESAAEEAEISAKEAESSVSEDQEIAVTSVSEDTVLSEGEFSVLSAEQLETAEVLKEELKKLENLTAGEDYEENGAFFSADSEEEAKAVAEQYNAELKSFTEGVATIEFREGQKVEEALSEVVDAAEIVTEAVETAGIEVSDIPDTPVYPDAICRIVEADAESLETAICAAGANQWFHESVGSDLARKWGHTGSGINVAVLDTGIDYSHPELRANVMARDYVVGGSGRDTQGHGTHVAGIIAATGAAGRALGIAPKAKIYSVRVAVGSSFNSSQLLAGLNHIYNNYRSGSNKVRIVNMSVATESNVTEIKNAINKLTDEGMICVAAAGNDEYDTEKTPEYPAAYDNVISVGAYDKKNNLCDFSNYGSKVDLAAPGGDILSTYPTDTWGTMSGTSQATPIVVGALALLLEKEGKDSYNVTSARTKLQSTANNTDYSYYSRKVHYGLNIKNLLSLSDVSTPAAPNITKTVNSDKSVSVNMSTSVAGAEIYYTTDGSYPAKSSGKYSSVLTFTADGSYYINAVTYKDSVFSSLSSLTFTIGSGGSGGDSGGGSGGSGENNTNSGTSNSGTAIKQNEIIPSGKKYTSIASNAAFTSRPVKYSVYPKGYCKVSKKGVLIGKKSGTTVITGYIKEKNGKKTVYVPCGTLTVNVVVPKLSKKTWASDSSFNVKEMLSGAEGLDDPKWSSSKSSVASVDPSTGAVTIRGKGSTKIIADYGGGKKIKATLKIVIPTISKRSAKVKVGKTIRIKMKNAQSAVSWSSSNPAVAVVDSYGYVTGVSKGSATITATVSGISKTYTCNVSVR